MAPPVDDTLRYDLYLCAASSSPIAVASSASARPSSIDAGDLASAVFDSLQESARQSGRTPSVFYAPRCVHDSYDEAKDAMLQTRGGGTALCMLSKPFLLEDRCVGELLQFLTLDADAQDEEKVKFLFVCVGVTSAEIFQDPRIGPYAVALGWHRMHAIMLTTLSAATFEIVKLAWDAWLSPSSPNVLGATVKESLLDLLDRVFHGHEVSEVKLVLGVEDPKAITLADVFSLALSTYKIDSGYDFRALQDKLATIGPGFLYGEKRATIAAYQRKWSLAGTWDWSSHARDRLKPIPASLLSAPASLLSALASRVNPGEDAVRLSCRLKKKIMAMSAPPTRLPPSSLFNVRRHEADPFVVKTALIHGASKLRSVRVLLLGGSERGKTSTVESLLGHAFVENRPSTRGIDLETHCLTPGLRGPSVKRVWKSSITVDSFAAAVSRVRLQPASQAQRLISSQHGSGAPLDRSNETSRASIPRNAHPTQVSSVHRRVLDAAARALSSPIEIRGDNGQLLRIWDFGGQKEYEACHQLFMSQRSVLMLVIDLQKLWCEGTRDEEFAELIPWLRCAFSLTERPEAQHVVVVGTRKNTCGDVEGAWEALEDLICRWSSTVYNTWVRAPATGGAAMMKKIALENDGAIVDADGSGLLELEEHLCAITGQIIENSEPVPVKWRALLEELVGFGQYELFLTKEKVMEVASGLPGFPESTDSLDVTVMEMLRYCRDLGELILFEISSELDCNLPVKGDTCIVFVDPEKLLDVLRTTIGPCKDVLRRLEARHRLELREKGLVDMEALDVLWGNVPKSYRFTMLIMLCRFDLLVRLEWHERGRRMVGIPALMPQLGSDADCFVERMGRGHDERDLEVYTMFTELFPVGLIGVLIASLHNTVGGQRTAVHDFRADGALLTLKKGERVFVKYVPHGQDSMGAHIKWLFRGKAPVGIAHRCLQQFYVLMQSQFRKVATTSYRHVIILDCARDLSCCPSDVADCDGHGCGGKGSVELEIDCERLWDDSDSSELRIGGCQCSKCTVFHDHAPLRDPVVGRPTAVVPSQSVISEPSPKRYDLLISCHGEQKLRDLGNSAAATGAHVRDLASAVDVHVKAFARDHSRAPSVFLIDAHSDVYKGVMQLRGGGVGLFLLTREFFRNKRCVGALLSCLDYAKNGKNGSTVQLRLVCLERDVEDIFNEIVKSLFPELGVDHALLAVETGTVAETAENITKKIVWEAWTVPQEGENHAVLGGDIEQSFRDLTSFFGEDYFAVAKSVLEVQSRGIESVGEVFDLAKANSAPLGCHNVEALRDITLNFRAPAAPRERNESAIRAYEKKWMFARMWEWGSSERDRLEKQCTKGMEGRWESLRARLLHREESRERPCPR